MSESLSIVEITDTSINVEAVCEFKETSDLDTTTKTKRQLSESDLEERSAKKIRTSVDEKVIADVTEPESIIENETIVDDSKAFEEEDCPNETIESSVLEHNVCVEKSSELLVDPDDDDDDDNILEEVEIETKTQEELEEEEVEAEDEKMGEESFEYQEESELSDHSSDEEDDDDDDVLMARAMEASVKRNLVPSKPFVQNDDEPIALDDSDDEAPPPERGRKDSERSSEYSIDNQVIGDSEESDEENEDPHIPRKQQKVTVLLAQRIVKKSFRFLRRKVAETKGLKENQRSLDAKSTAAEDTAKFTASTSARTETKSNGLEIVAPEVEPVLVEVKEKPSEVEAMDVSIEPISSQPEAPQQLTLPPTNEQKQEQGPVETTSNESQEQKTRSPQLEKTDDAVAAAKIIPIDAKTSASNSNDSSRHDSSLLTEISNSSIEEIFNRYIVKNTEQSPTLDEFSEELFYCLQQNKQEIEKAQQLWNEKLHVKYKIRELMETIRRHRAVMEIETFGYKPENAPNNTRPVISSKSSTTTNSEADHYEKHFRMSSESVSRLIQDVRASMLKRDDKQREDLAAATNSGEGGFENSSLAAQWNNLQAQGAQGRQGQIIDVQSIINDFRQKNPQEIPRRGRRMKSSFGSFYDNQQSQMEDSRGSVRNDFMANASNNSHDFNSTLKTNSGYPEVSLHPVHNLYKNLSNSPGPSGSSGAHFSGQKSSLLQSILTKQSTKSPGFHQNHAPLPSTSTLARLLTAPERSFQGAPKLSQGQLPPRQSTNKVHNNGEITITPIGHNNSRNKDFSMDDEDNSMEEPPLVIDETEDFEAAERSNVKSVSDLLCQGCKKNKAFFMCAGCSRQWYCSKECQEMAWDEHAESCMI